MTVEDLLDMARTLVDQKEKMECYKRIVQECADCTDAINQMNKFPPEPPKEVKVKIDSETIKLEWISLYKDDTLYRIFRQEGVSPKKKIGETKDCTFVDRRTEAGKKYTYTIYTVRGDKVSENGTSEGPLMRMAEVEKLRAISQEGQINLSWKVPAKTKIEVWKKEGSIPIRRGDGEKLSGVKHQEVVDTNLSTDQTYGYLILVQYEDDQGRPVFFKWSWYNSYYCG